RNGENANVAGLRLPAGQDELIEAVHALGKPVVLVVLSGRPVTLTRAVRHAAAVLYAWHPGSRGAAALAEVLFGAAEPGGRLPVSLARSVGQVPVHYNHKSTGRPWIHYHDQPAAPLFPFGFGLGYTTFSFADIAVERAEIGAGDTTVVSAQVTNTGARAGEAVAQCYVQDCVASTTRPVRELKGFARVRLEPGEARRVAFTLGPDELGFYGRNGRRRVEPGQFTVWIGADSTAALETTFWVR
ncbi:MAG: glycoside hydrolase family 3 C-terminal domain-containing protein, partial [Anaerolineales bacterium]|nr:glycoside hydrolase family 3 C-terminal domain-containing protein [Anaerolineales bacterium]